MTTLIVSSRHTEDNQSLWRAATARGWDVVRAQGIRVPEVDDEDLVIYVESLFAPTVAKRVGRRLQELPEDWMVRLPYSYAKRMITITSLAEARNFAHPMFVKPPNDKSFEAKVYECGADLPVEYDDGMTVLVSEPVLWEGEYRCFCLDGKALTVSPYYRSGVHAKLSDYEITPAERSAVIEFAESVLAETGEFTPRAVVIDIGELTGHGLAVVEANAAWGSGIYGCDPAVVLDVLRRAITCANDAD
ncbi:ATP-grasp domain-containing protein [Bremerella sp.]|uniref:ATP-grasp domain-containing protein n=1 Tax=Bremerella sp. TaxID=2795602 RepID=UPI00391896BC